MAASPASVGGGAYSCEMAEQTRQWMEAIAAFLRLHRPLLEVHVVNFFKDRLWEMVDAEWMECLRGEPVESLIKLPSGCVQVLEKYFPVVSRLSPSIGGQGKTLRCQRLRKVMESHGALGEKNDDLPYSTLKEQNIATDVLLPTGPTDLKGAFAYCSHDLSTGDTYSTSGVVDSAISGVSKIS